MPRYYFNIYNDDTTMDDQGAELPDDIAAQEHGNRAVRSLAAHTVLEGHLTGSHYVEIVDDSRRRVATIRFDEAVELRP
jgi:hypothetical protein